MFPQKWPAERKEKKAFYLAREAEFRLAYWLRPISLDCPEQVFSQGDQRPLVFFEQSSSKETSVIQEIKSWTRGRGSGFLRKQFGRLES